ncbi:MAG: SufE family protein [Prevotellaceae bacterium]|jgi:cysteine desulfuration protein SufE|nr:SufE family protein [Prevotellaceae bacterium]
MSDTINDMQNRILDEFAMFSDWMDKYEYLIDLGRDLAPYDPKYKTDEHLIDGCQSKVWVHGFTENGKMKYTADSDAIITKGMISLLIRVFSNREPSEILNADLFFIERIGLKENLSSTRSNGLAAMIRRMTDLARKQQNDSENG